jgi:Ribonuclease G/E
MSNAPDRIFISRSPGETRAALVWGEQLLEVVHLRDTEAQPGAIYVGRVGERLPGAADVFVDIGIGPHGLLEAKGQKFTTGQRIAVEVLTPARAEKGHKLKLAQVPLPADDKAQLIQAAVHPTMVWAQAYQASLQEIVVDPPSQKRTYEATLRDIPVVTAAANDFTWAEIEEQIDEALQTELALPRGGRIRFEQTSALLSIDIDAAASSIDQANADAMDVIARQMRLRNLAGHLLVDLIHMKGKQRFVDALKAACAADPVETRILGLTPSGMIDIVRQRTRPSLAEMLKTADATAYRALRMACRELIARRASRIEVALAPPVAAVLQEQLRDAYDEAVATAKGSIAVSARPGFALDRVEISA